MNEQEAQQLLEKYSQGLCTPREKALVEHWYQQELAAGQLPDMEAHAGYDKEEIWKGVLETTGLKKHPAKYIILRRAVAAASILLVLGTAAYFYFGRQPLPKKAIAGKTTNEILPGVNKATLTLADGSKIDLDDASGLVAVQSGMHVRKTKDGRVVYEGSSGTKQDAAPVPQKIETPNGGQFQVTLPDGTQVWLNAASELRFPSVFTGDYRIVDLKGEAYFEVAKNKKMPFIVRAQGTETLVTGTHFNVMAYEEENHSATTLLEGSVQVSNSFSKVLLSPGQQAVNTRQMKLSKSEVDVETVIAWKNGLFKFDNADIETVMRQLSRWYDVTVQYKGKVPDNHFTGYISRNSKLSQVLKMLELSGVEFQVEDRKINVL